MAVFLLECRDEERQADFCKKEEFFDALDNHHWVQAFNKATNCSGKPATYWIS